MSVSGWVPVTFSAPVKSGRTVRDREFRSNAPVTVPCVPRDDFVEAAVCAVGPAATRIRWLHGRDSFWRPVLAPDLSPVGSFADFCSLCERLVAERAPRWDDFPLAFPMASWRGADVQPFSLPEANFDAGAHSGTSVLKAAADAGRDLVELDGVLHRRTRVPYWGLVSEGCFPYGYGRIALCIPDLSEPPAIARFALDRREDAAAFVEETLPLVRAGIEAGRFRPLLQMEAPDPAVPDGTAALTDFRGLYDGRLETLRAAASDISTEIGRGTLSSIPIPLLSAYARLMTACTEGRTDEAAAAMQDYAASIPAEWRDGGWPAGEYTLAPASVALWRDRFAARMADEADLLSMAP